MGREQRQSERFRVALRVRYSVAREFVLDYAENLSEGGLFVRGAEQLAPGDRVSVDIELPGYDSYLITAEVAHVLTQAEAASVGRRPGAGLSILESPEDFEEALRAYLLRLGRRRDHVLLVADPSLGAALEEAGYHVRQVPSPAGLLETVAASDLDVLAVVVGGAVREGYEAAAEQMGAPELVRVADTEADLEALLGALDDELEAG